ncbi:MAG: hypothetical protein LBL73_04500 [Synergistaceae bacterium]|jgi:N-methylhydantoinase B/oxoprolinase/acetone carboxylase alpha subunit|nr:hypothetical protein [Synergistaceae bacterium]
MERDPGQVALDVKNGFISEGQSKNDYGVIVDADTCEITGFCEGRG